MTLKLADLREVRALLYPVRRKWYDIGIELGLNIDELDTIKAKHSHSDEFLKESLTDIMVKMWLKFIKPLLTWRALGDVLKAEYVDEAGLAEKGMSESPQVIVFSYPQPKDSFFSYCSVWKGES